MKRLKMVKGPKYLCVTNSPNPKIFSLLSQQTNIHMRSWSYKEISLHANCFSSSAFLSLHRCWALAPPEDTSGQTPRGGERARCVRSAHVREYDVTLKETVLQFGPRIFPPPEIIAFSNRRYICVRMGRCHWKIKRHLQTIRHPTIKK